MLFYLKKIITPFLMPPGVFIPLLILSCFYTFKKSKKVAIFNLIIATLIWAFSITPVSDLMLSGLEKGLRFPQDPLADCIVLLGGGIIDGVVDMTGTGIPTLEMQGRILTCVRAFRKFHIPIIISGGQPFKKRTPEYVIVRRFLLDLGVPDSMIIVEKRSKDTWENARYSALICKKKGFKKALLITSAYHMKRAIFCFKRAGMDIIPFPANFFTSPGKEYIWKDFLPHNFLNTYRAIHEYLGIIFYKIAY